MINFIPWVLLSILYSPILFQLYSSRWETIDYTHAYFILPVSLFLVWLKRKQLKILIGESRAPHSISGIAALIIGIIMYIAGWRRDYLFISTLSLIPVLFGLTAYLYGPKISRCLRFPIFYLLLLAPPPLGILDALTLPMRYGVSLAAYIILRSFNFAIAREGLTLSIEGQQLFMGPACSGFRSLITALSLGLAYAYLSKAPAAKKRILMLSIIPLALFGNLIRVIALCLIAYYFGEKSAEGFLHDASGMVVFAIVILGLLGIDSLLHRKENE